MKTFKITKEDIVGVAERISQTLTEKEIDWVLLCYGDAQREDPSGTWDLVVEDLVYQAINLRKKDPDAFDNPRFGEDSSTDDTWFDRENDSMTKDEAIEAMKAGKRVTHKYFSPEEWITMEDGMIVTEDGYRFSPESFWRFRTKPYFDNDWKLFKE
jgi:hypothetical protein